VKFKLSKRTTKADLILELQELQLIENEYRQLLDESSDPIFAFYPDGCVFRAKAATIPAGNRPPFRRESGHHSALMPATVPEQSGQF
jgi:hypothetical protein